MKQQTNQQDNVLHVLQEAVLIRKHFKNQTGYVSRLVFLKKQACTTLGWRRATYGLLGKKIFCSLFSN